MTHPYSQIQPSVKKEVYLDYNASSPLDSRIVETMMSALTNGFGNASSVHRFGKRQTAAVDEAREHIAELVGGHTSKVIFTSGATEANNLALKGIVAGTSRVLPRILISSTEHSSVLKPARWLNKQGLAQVDFIPVENDGILDMGAFERLINNDVLLVSVMSANGETGVLNPIEEIAEIAHRAGAFFHCDITQSIGRLPFNLEQVGADLITLSSHKICGPGGVGALATSNNALRQIQPIIHGGEHEQGLRSGSLNVAGIIGFGMAAQITVKEKSNESERVEKLRDRLITGIKSSLTGVSEIGNTSHRLPNTACVRFHDTDAEAVVSNLDPVAVSTGSACNSSSITPSEVLLAMGVPWNQIFETVRFSLGRFTNSSEIDFSIKKTFEAVEYVRSIEARLI